MLDTPLDRGREALFRHNWTDAVEALSEADRAHRLEADDLDRLAEAQWWSGAPDDAVETWERAFAGYVASDRIEDAALVALHLGNLAYRRGAASVGNGWMARAERLVADLPESPVHGWLKAERAVFTMLATGDTRVGAEMAEEALDIARRTGDRELETMSLGIIGTALVRQGRWQEGMSLIDEAALAAGSGELRPRTACDVYCITITTCCEATDYRRAREWTDHVDRWMDRHAIHGYRGECKVHRAELKRRRGDLQAAESEALEACQELEDYRLLDSAATAHYEIGEIRLRLGDLGGAQAAFDKAHELGRDPQPGLALLQLLRGDVESAVAGIDRSLQTAIEFEDRIHTFDDLLTRASLLPAAVEIHIAAGGLEQAAAYATELEEIAEAYESEALSAAMTRTLLGRALLEVGEETAARMELRAARSAFSELGAVIHERQVAKLLGEEDSRGEHRVRLTFMFTDIVRSTDMAAALGDEAWTQLLQWHDRNLREAFVQHHGQEVKHTGDGFFVAFENAADAIACAVAIQRLLDRQRRDHGFAPRVRIGLHTAEATYADGDYSGHGVHVAARIGAIAEGDEILVSSVTREAAGEASLPTGEPREVTLKGVQDPVEVSAIEWR